MAKVSLVAPVKGACGASTIACHLAHQWRRKGMQRVLLADLDPLTGTVAFQLKLKSPYSFVDALNRTGNLDSELWKNLITATNGVDVLLSPENPVDGINDLGDPGAIIEYARACYDAVVVDASGPYGNWSLSLARLADEVLLVTTNELPALQATQRVLAYYERARLDRSKIKLVVNRYNRDIGLGKEVIETALHLDVQHLIPSDYEGIQNALIQGKTVPPGSTFGKSLAALASQLAGNPSQPLAEKKNSSLFKGLLSLLRRG
jgi:pilus assembly protein CpaE